MGTTDHSNSSHVVGGHWGHLLRRFIHMCMAIIPILYVQYGPAISAYLGFSVAWIVFFVILLFVFFDLLRLRFRWLMIGQRGYEKSQMSSMTWGALAIGLVLILAPGPSYSIPIVAACAFADPIMGELKSLSVKGIWIAIVGILTITIIWLISHFLYNTPWWLALLMGPITVASEWPSWPWIDDNFLMQMVPLILVLLLRFFGAL